MNFDLQQIGRLVRQAGIEELLPRFRNVTHEVKSDGSLLTEADLAVDTRLRRELHALHPDVAFLSEEMEPDRHATLVREQARGVWCLDPLDGTSNFAAGLPFFGISLALLAGGGQRLGIVYDPVRDELFMAERDRGASLNGAPLRCPVRNAVLAQSVAMIDFKRLPPALTRRLLAGPPYHSQRNLGACALEWAWMAAGRGHVYLHGGQQLWDQAAGSLILAEAGGFSSTMEGESVFRPSMEPRSVIAAPERGLFEDWRDWLADTT